MRAIGVALLLALTGSAGAEAQQRPPPPAPNAPPLSKLPDGRLQLFAGNAGGANFISLDQTAKSGDKVDLWFLTIPRAPYTIGADKRVAETLTHGALDCKAATYKEFSNEGFDAAGERVVWLPERTAEPIEPRSTYDFLSKVLCEGYILPPSSIVVGRRAATEAAQLAFARLKP